MRSCGSTFARFHATTEGKPVTRVPASANYWQGSQGGHGTAPGLVRLYLWSQWRLPETRLLGLKGG